MVGEEAEISKFHKTIIKSWKLKYLAIQIKWQRSRFLQNKLFLKVKDIRASANWKQKCSLHGLCIIYRLSCHQFVLAKRTIKISSTFFIECILY